jgi:hypothetical protein
MLGWSEIGGQHLSWLSLGRNEVSLWQWEGLRKRLTVQLMGYPETMSKQWLVISDRDQILFRHHMDAASLTWLQDSQLKRPRFVQPASRI